MTVIKVDNVSKAFQGKNILDGVSFAVKSGELVALLGPSGVGKTTLLKIIAGLERPDSGGIYFGDRSVVDVPVEKRGAVLVFQDYLLFPHLTVADNIAFGLKMAKAPAAERSKVVSDMLELVGMSGHEHKYPEELSGGQKQRVALARALAIKPQVLLLDEPFSNLDAALRASMREFIRDIQRKLNITTLLVTHDWQEALMYADRVAVILDGRLAQFGTPAEVYYQPCALSVAKFLGDDKNYVPGNITDGIFHCPLGDASVKGYQSGRYIAVIRPEAVELKAAMNSNWTVTALRFAGKFTHYQVMNGEVELLAARDGIAAFQAGDRVEIVIDWKTALFFPQL